MKATEMQFGQVNAALVKLAQYLNSSLDGVEVINSLNEGDHFVTKVVRYMRANIPQEDMPPRDFRKRREMLREFCQKLGWNTWSIAQRYSEKCLSARDVYAQYAHQEYWNWVEESGPIPHNLEVLASVLRTSVEYLKEIDLIHY